MEEINCELRKWGRSIGVVIPKESVIKEHLKEGDKIKILITKKNNVLREMFGSLKLKRSSEEMLKEIDEEGWDD